MAEVDSLEVKIEADSLKASNAIKKLIDDIGSLEGALKSINTSALSNTAKSLSQNFSKINGKEFLELNKSAKEAQKTINRISEIAKKGIKSKISFDSSDYQAKIKELNSKFADAGKNFKVEGNLSQIEKQSEKLGASLIRLKEREEEIITIGKKSPESEMFQKLQYNITAATNKLGILNEAIKNFKMPKTGNFELDNPDFKIIRYDVDFSRIEKSAETVKEKAESVIKSIPESAKYSISEAQKSLSDAMKNIHIEPDVDDSFRNYTKEISEATEKLKELEASGKGMGSDEWDETYISLQKVKQSAKEYKEQLDNPSDGTEEDIKRTNSLGNKIEKLREKLKELKAQGLNFGDAKFDKTYSELNKAEAGLKEYKESLNNAGKESKNFSSISLPNFQKTTNALKNMGNSALDTGNKLTSFPSLMKKFNSSTKNAPNGFKNLKGAIISAVGTIAGSVGVFNMLKESIDLSSNLTEQQNVIDVSFGKYKKSIEKFAKISVPQFGMSELTAKTIAGRFQSMGVAIGYSQKQMAGMSVELTKLAADMASFYNVEQDSVAKSLESVFTGTTEPMRRYGIDLTQATLEEWAHKQGIDAKMQSMSQAEKTMLRYQYVMDNTSAAQGDFVRTADTWANQIRVLKQSFEVLGSTVGGVLINVLKPFVKGLNVIMGYINEFAKTVSNALGKIFGWTYEEGGGVTNPAEDLADSMGDIAGETDKATEAQKKFNKQLAKFDELNNYTTSEGSGKDKDKGSGDLSGLGGASGGKWIQGKSIVKEFESEIDSLYKLGKYIGDTLKKAMDSIDWDGVYKKARNFGKGLASFLNGLISPGLFYSLGRTIANSLNTALHSLDSFGKEFDWDNFGESIASGINSFFKNFNWKLAAETFNTLANGILDAMIKAVQGINWKQIAEKIAELINNIDASGIGWRLGKLAGSLANAFYQLVSNKETWINLGQKIADGINEFLKGMNEVDKDTGLTGWEALGKGLTEAVSGIVDMLIIAIDGIEWDKVGKGIKDFIVNIGARKISWKFNNLIKSFSGALSEALEGATGIELSADGIEIGIKFSLINWAIKKLTGTSILQGIWSGVKLLLKNAGILKGGSIVISAAGISNLLVNIGAALSIGIPSPTTDDIVRRIETWFTNNVVKKVKVLKAAADLWDKFCDAIIDVMDGIGDIFSGAWKDTTAITDGIDIGNDLANGILKGFANALVYPAEFLYNLLVKPVKEALGIHSPSTVFKEIAGYCIEGFFNGIKDIGNKVKEKLRTSWEVVINWAKSKMKLPKVNVPSIESLVSWIKGKWDDVKNWWNSKAKLPKVSVPSIGDLISWIQGKWNDVKNWWDKHAKLPKLKLGFDMAVSGIKSALNTVIGWINKYIIGALNKISIKIPEIKIAGKSLFKGKSFGFNISNIQMFASGGMPSTGQMFIAREAGAELVGNIGNKTAVMNNDQIVTSVSAGVAKAVKDSVVPYLKKIAVAIKNQNFSIDFPSDADIESDSQGEGDAQQEQQTEFVVSTKDIIEINSLNNDFNDMVIGWEARIEELAGKLRESVGEPLKESAEDLFSGIGDKLNDTWANAQEILSGIPEYIETNVTSPISEKLAGIFEPVKGFLEETQKSIDDMKMSFGDIWNEISTVYQEAIRKMKTSSSSFFKSLNGSISSSSAKINDLLRAMEDVNIKTSSSKKFKVEKGKVAVKAYAAGGFPDTGQLFVAREAGAELVGNIGGRASVVSNDQIVEAVSEGVAKAVYPAVYGAVTSALSNSGNGDISIQIDGESVFRAVRNKDNEFRKRTGRGAFAY